jgi:DNA-binding transcriptional MerR regulator
MPERMYKIGEASQILKLKSYVLRFWETEFPQLNPARTGKGQRLYSEADLDLLKSIRHLLHERGLTIEGARKLLQSGGGDPGWEDPDAPDSAYSPDPQDSPDSPGSPDSPDFTDFTDEENFSGTAPDGGKRDSAMGLTPVPAPPSGSFPDSAEGERELLRQVLEELKAISSMLRSQD